MPNFEVLHEKHISENNEWGKKVEIAKEDVIKKILELKKESEFSPNSVNLHLKDIPEDILIASLANEDIEAFKEAFNNEWLEGSEDFKNYEESVLEWKRKERMDSGESPTLKIRRNFAAMIRNYVIDLTAKKKEEDKH